MRTVRLSLLALAAAATAGATAEPGVSPQAAEILQRAIAAHSDGPVRLRLTYRGSAPSPDQSANIEGPFRSHPWQFNVAFDEATQSLAFNSNVVSDGDFAIRNRAGFSGATGFSLTYLDEYDELTRFPPFADPFLPSRYLRSVAGTVTSIAASSDSNFDRITYEQAPGLRRTLSFDKTTHLLASVQLPTVATAFGDQTREAVYGSYRRIGNAMVPQAITLRVTTPLHGTTNLQLRLEEASAEGPQAAELRPPPGAPRHQPVSAEFATVPLGTDVYLLRNVATIGGFSYNVLAVVFTDHVLIVEAPFSEATSRRVLEAVAQIAPGMPVRTLVQTHHHGDHIGGIRTYIARGTTIVGPLGMQALLERVATTHSSIAPDALAAAPRSPIVEEVNAERTIRDARNEIRIFDVPNEHSDHMLVVYLPQQRILFQGDLINVGEYPLNRPSRQFLAWVRRNALDVGTVAGVHGIPLSGSEAQALLATPAQSANR